MSNKVKLLFVVSEFWQAGGERQAFDINNTIDRSRFSVEILCCLPLNGDPDKEDYYYSKHIALNSRVTFLNDFVLKRKRSWFRHLGKTIQYKKPHEQIKVDLAKYTSNFDQILFFGEYTFRNTYQYLDNIVFQKSMIFIHNSRFQVPDNYIHIDTTNSYHFVSGFSGEEIKNELVSFKDYKHTYIPLSIDCNQVFPKQKKHVSNNKKKKIGLFTRLTIHKPLDLFYYALHLLRARGCDAELYVYGTGEPLAFRFNDCIDYLDIKDCVHFRGHQNDIQNTAVEDELDLVWFHSYYGVPGGYASFDICMTETPQIFWNFTPKEKLQKHPAFPVYSDLDEFVKESFCVLSNGEKGSEIGKLQFETISRTRNIREHIKTIEGVIFEKLL